jgi:hypothetical protein
MASFFRSLAAVVAGFVVATAIMMAVEWTNGHQLYPEVGAAAKGLTDREAIRQLFATVPVGALLVVVFGWALGSLAGGFTTTKLSPGRGMTPAIVLAIILLLAGIANNVGLPPPSWFWVVSLVALAAGTFAGGRLAHGQRASGSGLKA